MMKNIGIQIPISCAFEQQELTLNRQLVTLTFIMEDGKRTLRTAPIRIGTFAQIGVFAVISIGYSYNSLLNEISIAGVESVSEEQLKIHTFLKEDARMAYTHSMLKYNKQTAKPNIWSAYNDVNDPLKRVTTQLIKDAIHSIHQELLLAGINTVSLSSPTSTKSSDNSPNYHAMLLTNSVVSLSIG